MKTKVLKLILLSLFILVGISAYSSENKKTLSIRFEWFNGRANSDNSLRNMLGNIVKDTPSLQKEYEDSPNFIISDYYDTGGINWINTIASLSPLIYAKEYAKQGIEPIFIVKKETASKFYNCIFVVSKNSKIKSIQKDFDQIKTFYFVNENSVSGFIYPIRELCKLDLIEAPCLCKLKNKNGVIKYQWCGSHKEVRKAVSKDPFGVGATYLPDDSTVIIHTCIEQVSQDVIVISKDLHEYKDAIKNWFLKNSEEHKEIFINSSQQITGIIDFDGEDNQIYYDYLFKAYNEVESARKKYCEGNINLEWFKNWIAEKENKSAIVATIIASVFIGIISYSYSLVKKAIKKKRKKKELKRKKNYRNEKVNPTCSHGDN
ncbi:MAG: phosphate/phosphite/phosphonate ABC transporter substrate-binding protein [Candidatus Azobacteroides sp.]|nr:phosphate/phosphite/phosphonate ABC transporter substrate-binding protein [Candidatus Azobacteroides sp.]